MLKVDRGAEFNPSFSTVDMDLRVRDSEVKANMRLILLQNAPTCRGKGEGVEVGRTRGASVR